MVKRKGLTVENAAGGDGAESSGDDDTDMLDVEFEWFDPQAIDFHGLKLLLRQLFDIDSEILDLSAISELIIQQPLLGSTVKTAEDGVDTINTDPFAFLSVLNLHTHRDNPAIRTLLAYLSLKATRTPALSALGPLLSADSPARVGLILTERFLNMPAEIVPPMYRMLVEEIQWAIAADEPYAFTHYLILSKTYTEITSALDDPAAAPAAKRSKQSKAATRATTGETFFFHPEDEVWQRHAMAFADFEFSKEADAGASDSKRAFQEAGIRPLGHMILIEESKFEAAVTAVEEYLKP